MTMKEQERKALEQIRRIVAGLGEDSYIGTAFEGCFEVAEENIENDFACSMKQRAEAAERKAEELAATAAKNEKAVMDARNYAADLEDQLSRIEAQYEKQIASLQDDRRNADDAAEALADRRDELELQNMKLRAALDARDVEILKLKARLFDLLYTEK